MMAKKAAVKAVSLIWLGSLAGAACAFLTQVILARQLGPVDFGTFSAALATVTLVAPLAAFGVPGYWLKVFGEEGWRARRSVPASFWCVTLTTALILSALMAWALIGPHDVYTRHLLALLSLCVLSQLAFDLVSAKLQLEERYQLLAGWQLLPNLSRFAIAISFSAAMWTLDISMLAAAYAAASCVIFVVGLASLVPFYRGALALKQHGNAPEQNPDGNANSSPITQCGFVFGQSWPFALASLFYIVYYQSQVVLVKHLAGSSEAGIYNVAFVIMTAVYLLPGIFYQKFMLSRLHQWASHDEQRFYRTYRIGNRVMLVSGLVVMGMLWVGAAPAVNLVFGLAYEASISLIKLLALSAPIHFVTYNFGAVLSTKDHMRKSIRFMGITAATNVALNFAFIPLLGAYGAAIATIISEFLLLVLFFIYAERRVFYGDKFRMSVAE